MTPAQGHSGRLVLSHRRLLWRVALTELRSRYAGSVLGTGWAVLTPLILIAIYAAVYLVIFRIRVTGLSPGEHVLMIFCGLVPFLMTSDALSNGVSAVVANRAALANTVFPIDLAPVKAVLLSQIPMVVGFATVLLALPFVGTVRWTVALLPLVWGLHVMGLIGLIWVLSLVNLVFRDLPNLVSLLLMVVMIISPIAYAPDMVPRELRFLILFNPFAYFVLAYQQVVIFGRLPDAGTSLVLVGLSLVLFALGGYFFGRAKRVFVDYV